MRSWCIPTAEWPLIAATREKVHAAMKTQDGQKIKYIFKKSRAGKGGFCWVQSFSPVQLFATPWTAACQASLSITNSQSLLKLISIELVMPSNHLIFCCPLLLPPSIFPSIRVFSNESVLHIKWSKYWIFSFSISPSNDYSGLFSFSMEG